MKRERRNTKNEKHKSKSSKAKNKSSLIKCDYTNYVSETYAQVLGGKANQFGTLGEVRSYFS